MYVTDLRHYFDDGKLVPYGPAKKMGLFLGQCVMAASQRPEGVQSPTVVPCQRRPNHCPCPGPVVVQRRKDGIIEWACGSCSDQGIIQHWENTHLDFRNLKTSGDGEKATLRFAADSFAVLIDSKVTLSLEDEAFLLRATAWGDSVTLTGTREEFENLLEGVAGEVNHAPNRYWRKKLERIYDEIRAGLGDGT